MQKRARSSANRRFGRDGGRRGGGGAPAAPLVSFGAGGGTFTRASESSYYTSPPNTTGGFLAWASSNVIREDRIDGVGGGYLLEGSQQNLCLESEFAAGWSFDLGAWNVSPVVAPDGAVDCRVAEFTANINGRVYRQVAGTSASTNYTTSVWVRKPAGAGTIYLWARDRSGADLFTGALTVGTTWTRIEHVWASAVGAVTPFVGLCNKDGTLQNLEIWGMQVEDPAVQGSFPTSYIRTTTAAVTRASDSLSFADSPLTMRSGRWYCDFAPLYTNAENNLNFSTLFSFSSSSADFVAVRNTDVLMCTKATVDKYLGPAATWSRNQIMRATWDMLAFQATLSGATTGNGTGAAGADPAFNAGYLNVGNDPIAFAKFFNGRIWEPRSA